MSKVLSGYLLAMANRLIWRFSFSFIRFLLSTHSLLALPWLCIALCFQRCPTRILRIMAADQVHCAALGRVHVSLPFRRAFDMSLMVRGEYQGSDPEICQSVRMCFQEAAGAMLLPASQTFKMPPAF